MAMLQAVAAVGLLAILVYSTIWLTNRTDEPRRSVVVTRGRWKVGHHDVEGATRVVLHKVSEGDVVLDEHVIDTISTDDPAYDEKFLGAMTTARQRQALFESEEG